MIHITTDGKEFDDYKLAREHEEKLLRAPYDALVKDLEEYDIHDSSGTPGRAANVLANIMLNNDITLRSIKGVDFHPTPTP